MNGMKGLDDYIMGIHDPNAPFNQTDWSEEFDHVIDKCDWITEAMLAEDETYQKLGELMQDVYERTVEPKKYYTSKERHQFLKDNAQVMADKLKIRWDKEGFIKEEEIQKRIEDGATKKSFTRAEIFFMCRKTEQEWKDKELAHSVRVVIYPHLKKITKKKEPHNIADWWWHNPKQE